MQGSNPIYNLLPDILSGLSAQADLAQSDFQVLWQPTYLICEMHWGTHSDSAAGWQLSDLAHDRSATGTTTWLSD